MNILLGRSSKVTTSTMLKSKKSPIPSNARTYLPTNISQKEKSEIAWICCSRTSLKRANIFCCSDRATLHWNNFQKRLTYSCGQRSYNLIMPNAFIGWGRFICRMVIQIVHENVLRNAFFSIRNMNKASYCWVQFIANTLNGIRMQGFCKSLLKLCQIHRVNGLNYNWDSIIWVNIISMKQSRHFVLFCEWMQRTSPAGKD